MKGGVTIVRVGCFCEGVGWVFVRGWVGCFCEGVGWVFVRGWVGCSCEVVSGDVCVMVNFL